MKEGRIGPGFEPGFYYAIDSLPQTEHAEQTPPQPKLAANLDKSFGMYPGDIVKYLHFIDQFEDLDLDQKKILLTNCYYYYGTGLNMEIPIGQQLKKAINIDHALLQNHLDQVLDNPSLIPAWESIQEELPTYVMTDRDTIKVLKNVQYNGVPLSPKQMAKRIGLPVEATESLLTLVSIENDEVNQEQPPSTDTKALREAVKGLYKTDLSYKRMAFTLGITEGTLRYHVSALLRSGEMRTRRRTSAEVLDLMRQIKDIWELDLTYDEMAQKIGVPRSTFDNLAIALIHTGQVMRKKFTASEIQIFDAIVRRMIKSGYEDEHILAILQPTPGQLKHSRERLYAQGLIESRPTKKEKVQELLRAAVKADPNKIVNLANIRRQASVSGMYVRFIYHEMAQTEPVPPLRTKPRS